MLRMILSLDHAGVFGFYYESVNYGFGIDAYIGAVVG